MIGKLEQRNKGIENSFEMQILKAIDREKIREEIKSSAIQDKLGRWAK